jgi:hypothetical protein
MFPAPTSFFAVVHGSIAMRLTAGKAGLRP